MSNRSEGNAFEQYAAMLLRKAGFWAHNMLQGRAGQPADLLVIRGRYHALIDCKVVSTGGFRFSRIEPNQLTAMRMFSDIALEPGWFMIRWPNGEITMLSNDIARSMARDGMKALAFSERLIYGISLEEWMRRARDVG